MDGPFQYWVQFYSEKFDSISEGGHKILIEDKNTGHQSFADTTFT